MMMMMTTTMSEKLTLRQKQREKGRVMMMMMRERQVSAHLQNHDHDDDDAMISMILLITMAFTVNKSSHSKDDRVVDLDLEWNDKMNGSLFSFCISNNNDDKPSRIITITTITTIKKHCPSTTSWYHLH